MTTLHIALTTTCCTLSTMALWDRDDPRSTRGIGSPCPKPNQCSCARDVSEERRHSPFQVLDASAIEGIRGLAGESSSIYSCIQIYKALTPPAPPALSEERRGGGGLEPKRSCTTISPNQYFLLQISFLPTMKSGSRGVGTPLPFPTVVSLLILPCLAHSTIHLSGHAVGGGGAMAHKQPGAGHTALASNSSGSEQCPPPMKTWTTCTQGCPSGEKKGGARNTNRNERSRGPLSVLNNGWRLAAVGGWRLAAVSGWRLAVGGS